MPKYLNEEQLKLALEDVVTEMEKDREANREGGESEEYDTEIGR